MPCPRCPYRHFPSTIAPVLLLLSVAATCRAVQFLNNSQSLRCAAGVGPTALSPGAWNTAGSPYGPYRLTVRCTQTLPGVRYVTIQQFNSASNELAFTLPQVLRAGVCNCRRGPSASGHACMLARTDGPVLLAAAFHSSARLP